MSRKRRTVRVRDLIDNPPLSLKLVCRMFPHEHQYSANKADYWSANPDTAFYCCGRSMMLAHEITAYEEHLP